MARWIRALGGPAADQDDLIQEVFVVVYRRLHDFDGRNLAGWLYRIAAHQVRDYRRLVWIKYIFRRSVALSSEVASARPTPVMMLETRERQRNLERLLSRLSDPLRAAFVLFEIEGYTAEEISDLDRQVLGLLAGGSFQLGVVAETFDDEPVDSEPETVEEPEPAKPAAKKAAAKKTAAKKAEPEPEPMAEEPVEEDADEDLIGEEVSDEDLLELAVKKATEMVADGDAAKVREALDAAGASRVRELNADNVRAFFEALP